MNEQSISISHNTPLKDKKEESEDEYQVIQEDYHSSPKCGIKSQIVKKIVKNITFSPVEISMKPYFKYCVYAIKEEQKNNISQAEANQTKIREEKNNNNDFIANTNAYNKENKNNTQIIKMNREEECENFEIKEENDINETNLIKIIEKKSSELTLNLALKCSEVDKQIEKRNIKMNRTKKFFYHSLKGKDNENLKMKLNLKNKEDQNKNNHKNTQKNIYNILNNIIIKNSINSNKMNNVKLFQPEEKENETQKAKIASKNNIITQEKDKNNFKKELRMTPSLTSNSIKRIKKQKKNQENNDSKKIKGNNMLRQHSFIPLNKGKKEKMQIEDKDKDFKKIRRYSLMPNNITNNDNKKIFINIISNNQNKSKLKKMKNRQKKLKSLGEKAHDLLKIVKSSKKLENEKSGTPKRKINFNFKLKMEESFKDSDNNIDMPKTTKAKKRVSIFDNMNESKRKKMFTEDKNDGNIFKKGKSNFCMLKDKEKEKIKDKDKEKKTRNKKAKRNKRNKEEKDKKIKTQSTNQIIKKPNRRDKSFTIISKTNKNLIDDDKSNIVTVQNNNNNSNCKDNNNENNGTNSKNNSPNSNNPNKTNLDIRQSSTRNVIRDISRKENITALTNKQTINNMNEYTRQCLEIIPDLFDLGDKMPRCKAHINPNFSKDKKIALFDLDETIVHCIGEINIKNLDSLSRQSDAKLKVCLPGGKKEVTIGINIRPFWKEALEKIKDKYHIVAFTASHESYADSVLNYLDPQQKYFEYRLYRAHCVLCVIDDMKFYVKDLKILEDNYDLKDVVIIDNSILSFAYHLDNGIPISPFYDSKVDSELLDIADFLIKYADENDIRDKLKEVYKLNQYLEILKNYSSEEIENEDSSDVSVDKEDKNGGNTTKSITINKNRTNLNLNQPLIVNNISIEINNEKKEVNESTINNKNCSQVDIKFKDLTKLFGGNQSNDDEPLNHSLTPKLDDQIIKKSINKNIEEKTYKKKDKHKTIRFDFNFKREWDKKQKELKNT